MSDAVAFLAGFLLAHSSWVASELPEGELLVPSALITTSEGQALYKFEADTQELAVEKGLAAVRNADAKMWAFVRDGLLNTGEPHKVDVLLVEFWSEEMSQSAQIIQRYIPYHMSGEFRLVGEPWVLISGEVQDETQARPILDSVMKGFGSHEKAAQLLEQWKSESS